MQLPVFQNPDWLWLLLLAPLFLIRRRGAAGRARGAVIMATRLLVFAILVLTLAEPAFRTKSDAVTTYFILDRSGSVPQPSREWSLNVVRKAVEGRERPRKDRAGLIVFGTDPIVEESPTPEFKVDRIYSLVERSNTDISAAVRLALSTFPDDTQKRIVLFTDGNETRGKLRDAVDHAMAAGCPVDVVPLKYQYKEEVLLESLTLPRKVNREEPFQVRTNVVSLGKTEGTLDLFCDRELVARRNVSLRPGNNVFLFSHKLTEPGFHLFEAMVSSPGDGIPDNNYAQAYSIIEDASKALLVGGAADDVKYLAEALREEGVACDVRLAGAIPRDLGEWQSYDAIVFANLDAEHVSLAQMKMIEALVKDLGTGFMMVGGEKSFGAGGYLGTPIDRLLPISLDIKQKRVLPNGGIAFVLDHIHCIGDRWSKDICVGALKGLTRFDQFGLRVGGSSSWTVPLQPAARKQEIQRRIDRAHVGDIRDVDSHLQEVRKALVSSRSSYRHAVLVTDGRGGVVPGSGTIRDLRGDRISLSVVVIEPRGIDLAEFRRVAREGGGNFYVVQPNQYNLVPQIFIKESKIVKKGLYFEERFVPSMQEGSEILEGIAASELPALNGYNVSSRKDPTEIPLVSNQGDAVLAHWRYGLGRTVAFTSDASTRWASDWVKWSRYKQFWSQAVRWCQRRIPASPYQLTLQRGRKDSTCDAIIDAQDEKGNFVNFLSPRGTLITPDLEARPLTFEQTGPGRYRANFPADKSGGYIVNVRYAENDQPFLLRGGYVPPYNPEFRKFQDNEPLLLWTADQTGGRRMAPGMDFFAPTGAVAHTSWPVWPSLLLFVVCLFPFDVFVRRVIVGWSDAKALVRVVFPRLRNRADPVMEALAGEREAIRRRAAWEPGADTPEVTAERGASGREAAPGAEEKAAAVATLPAEDDGLTGRLLAAKNRVKRKYEER